MASTVANTKGRRRAKPGATGRGAYYHVIVRPKYQFVSFRNQDIGKKGGLERIAGHRRSGSWATQAWLVSKEMAHVEGETLVADHPDAKKLLVSLSTQPIRLMGDIFTAHDRRNVPEKEKPTAAQRKAWTENIKKAQAARRHKAPVKTN